ncbi:MAG: fumarylacetoacetate hydrolase family protein [Pirellulales bacterium]
MRLCRFQHAGNVQAGNVQAGFYADDHVVPLTAAADACGEPLDLPAGDDLLPLLPGGQHVAAASKLAAWLTENTDALPSAARLSVDDVQLLVPVPAPRKIFCLAGNYSKHIEEGGGVAPERAETFPYVFMKPITTLTHPGAAVEIPRVSPDAIDWELELAVVIGRTVKHATAANALDFVAGYTIVNDISNRRFRPNPGRKERPKDTFFDWLHGKWFDTFCPTGPCITSAAAISDPQSLAMQLRLNDEVRQDSSTAARRSSASPR